MGRPKSNDLPPFVDVHRGKYRVRIYAGGHQHFYGTYHQLKAAKVAAQRAEMDKAAGKLSNPAAMRAERKAEAAEEAKSGTTVRQWADTWLTRPGARGRRRAESTVRTYRNRLETHVLPELGDMRLVDVTAEDIDRVLDAVRDGAGRGGQAASAGLVINVATVVRSLFLAAVKDRGTALTVSPFDYTIPQRDHDEDDVPVLTTAEVDELAARMPAGWGIGVVLAGRMGLRLGEVLGLQRRDVEHAEDPDRAVLRVRRQLNTKTGEITGTKAGSKRDLALSADMAARLAEHLAEHVAGEPEASVVPSRQSPHRRASQSAYDRAWRGARDDAGLTGFRFHDLRHTHLTNYSRAGATAKETERRGGHRDSRVAMGYQHADITRDRMIVNRMDGDTPDRL